MSGDKNNLDKKKTTKEKILEAAIDLFAQKGFDATSMREIAEAVGIKKASMYSHFNGKDEILEKIIGYPLERAFTVGEQGVENEDLIVNLGAEGFLDLGGEVFTRWLEDPSMEKILRIIYIELYHNQQVKDFYFQLWEAAHAFWESNFKIMMKHQLIKSSDSQVLTTEFIMFFQAAFMDYYLARYKDASGSFQQVYQDRLIQHTKFILDSIKL